MKVGVLTSSRADFGIYLPLLSKLEEDSFFQLEIIAFGTHLSHYHGYTVTEIESQKFSKIHKISSLVLSDDEQGIASSYGLTILKFADFWKSNGYDLVICLGDRYEMSAAIQAGIPFGVKFAHIHGGETTLGAIDNIYRHQITHASILHFTATNFFYNKVAELTGSEDNVHLVGSLSLDGIENFKPIDKQLFYNEFKIPKEEFALVTFHPETLSTKTNEVLALEMSAALAQISRNLFLVITMPNADTYGSIYRKEIKKIEKQFSDKIKCIESFGKDNYFSAMYYSRLLIGNTSSGILEAASFGKYVVNVGDRQKGRLQSDNVINTPFNKNSIVDAVNQILSLDNFKGVNIYYQEKPALNIINQLKRNYARI